MRTTTGAFPLLCMWPLDERTTGDLVGLIERWHGEGRTILAVLHDYALVRAHFPDALLPDELKESNPLHIWRLVDGAWTR